MLHKIPIKYTIGNVDFVNTIDGNSPMAAYYNLGKKVVAINEYKQYNAAEQEALDCHEEAHLIYKNADEFAADKLGFEIFKLRGNTNFNAWVTAYTKVFAGTSSELVNNPTLALAVKQQQQKRLEIIKQMVLEAEKEVFAVAKNSGAVIPTDPLSGILQGGGSILQGLDGLFNGNKRAMLEHQAQVAALEAVHAQSAANVQQSILGLEASKISAALKANQTELIVVAAVVAVLLVIFYMAWKSGRQPKMAFPNPAALPNIKPQLT